MKTKFLFLMGMIAFSISTVSISASNSEMGVCGMSSMTGDTYYLSYRKQGNNHEGRPKHAPANYSYLPITWVENGALYFQGITSISSISVSIQDENGQEVLSTTINIQQGVTTSVDISALTSGDYTLYIVVNDLTFFAEFEL